MIVFGDPYFICGTEILTIGGHLPRDLDLSPSDLEHLTWSNPVPNFSELEQSAAEL